MGSISVWHWLIAITIVLLIFGSKHIRGWGADIAASVRNFRDTVKASKEAKDAALPTSPNHQQEPTKRT
jgi:sec-independent protein translocase protein TatA